MIFRLMWPLIKESYENWFIFIKISWNCYPLDSFSSTGRDFWKDFTGMRDDMRVDTKQCFCQIKYLSASSRKLRKILTSNEENRNWNWPIRTRRLPNFFIAPIWIYSYLLYLFYCLSLSSSPHPNPSPFTPFLPPSPSSPSPLRPLLQTGSNLFQTALYWQF